jgi:phage tail tape measure protein, TP901 family, core region
MASRISQLTVRLKDEVSGPAAKASRSIRQLDQAAKNAGGRKTGFAASSASLGRSALALGGASLSMYGLSRAIGDTIGKTADLDRRMTRLRVTAGASAAEMGAATAALQTLAVETALPLDKVASGLEVLVAQGRSLSDSMSMIGAIARTAQASGSEVEDIAKTADSVGTNFKIAGADMQKAFDIMVEGGKAGQFELKDMARYLPSLAPAAAAVGLKGAEGLEQLVAMLQVVRKGTGTTEEAASSMNNIFQKMESEETAKRFGKFGVDLRKEMKEARKNGRNLLEVFEELTAKALKGDLSKLPQLFSDMEFARGMRAILSFRGEWQRLQKEIRSNAPGSVLRDFNTVAQGARAEIDRLGEAWDAFQIRLGKKIEPAVVGVLRSIREQIDGTMIPQVKDLKVVRPGSLPASDPLKERIHRPAPGSGGYRSREGKGIEIDPELQSTRSFMSTFAKGMQAQRARQAPGTPISSGEKYVQQVTVPTMLEEIRGRAASSGGITPGESIRRQLAAEEKVRKLSEDYIAAQQQNKSLGLPPSRLEGGTFRANLTDQIRTILQNEAARGGERPPDDAAIAGRVDAILRAVEERVSGRTGADASNGSAVPGGTQVDASKVSAIQGEAAAAQKALETLDMAVTPTVDVSSIKAAIADVRALNAELAKVGANTGRATVAARNIGQEYESRRGGSFADWEHG